MNIIKIKLGNVFLDIVVIRYGDFVYIDYSDKFINIVKNIDIIKLIKIQGWKFWNICCILCDDFFVVMDSEDD